MLVCRSASLLDFLPGRRGTFCYIAKLQLVEHAHGIPPLELEEKGEESSTTRSEVSEL